MQQPTDKYSRVFFGVMFLLLFGSVAFGYWRFFIAKDYIIEGRAECDPLQEVCFVETVDVSCDASQEDCSEASSQETNYYKLVHKKASDISACEEKEGVQCEPLVCHASDSYCEEILCDPTRAGEEVTCADTEALRAEAEEESEGETECASGSDCAEPESSSQDISANQEDAEVVPEKTEPDNVSEKQKPELQ